VGGVRRRNTPNHHFYKLDTGIRGAGKKERYIDWGGGKRKEGGRKKHLYWSEPKGRPKLFSSKPTWAKRTRLNEKASRNAIEQGIKKGKGEVQGGDDTIPPRLNLSLSGKSASPKARQVV